MRRTKIVCTMGPNTNSRDLMKKLIETGMDVARFNFSHGDHDEQKMRMDMLKELRKELKTPVAILLDTKGPEIRTGVLKDGKKVNLVTGQTLQPFRRPEMKITVLSATQALRKISKRETQF